MQNITKKSARLGGKNKNTIKACTQNKDFIKEIRIISKFQDALINSVRVHLHIVNPD